MSNKKITDLTEKTALLDTDNFVFARPTDIPSQTYKINILNLKDTLGIDANTADIATNTGNIATNTSDISDLQSVAPTSNQKAAMDSANSPSGANPFATIGDIPSVPVHNDLNGLQGGTTNEYYHLSDVKYHSLTDNNLNASQVCVIDSSNKLASNQYLEFSNEGADTKQKIIIKAAAGAVNKFTQIKQDNVLDIAQFYTTSERAEFWIDSLNRFSVEGTGVIRAQTANYENLITDNQDLVNKKYVDDNSGSSAETYKDVLNITSDGQTVFNLANTPIEDGSFALYWNGVRQVEGVSFSRTGTSLTWTGQYLKTTDEWLIAYYHISDGVINSVTSQITNDSNSFTSQTTLDSVLDRQKVVTKTFIPDYNNTYLGYRNRSVSGSGSHEFSIRVPDDFESLISIKLIGIITSGADGSGKDIDLTSQWAAPSEEVDAHTLTDTATTYDFTGYLNKVYEIDISSMFPDLTASGVGSLFVDHNGIGGNIKYIAIKFSYNRN